MKMEITPDSTNRIVLTKEMRHAAAIRAGEALEVSISPGAILITPKSGSGRTAKKGRRKVYTGDLPDVNIADAVNRARHYSR